MGVGRESRIKGRRRKRRKEEKGELNGGGSEGGKGRSRGRNEPRKSVPSEGWQSWRKHGRKSERIGRKETRKQRILK